jgi:peptidoglycan/LPS O-acetylase OafA/YrhL
VATTIPAPEAVAPPPGNPRFPLFDSLRAIAALCIMVTHASLIANANTLAFYGGLTARLDLGVTVFFVISGFLLYRPFVAARFGVRPPLRLLGYARRRVLRIVPAYWVALTVLAIYPGLVGLYESGEWWRYYAFLQIYEPGLSLGGIVQSWSLAVEASFYLALPLFVFVMSRLGRRWPVRRAMRVDLAILAGLMVGCWATRTYALADLPHSVIAGTLAGTVDGFAIGMSLAVVSAAAEAGVDVLPRARRFVTERPLACWGIAAALLLVVSYGLGLPRDFAHVSPGMDLVKHLFYDGFALMLVLPAAFGDDAGGLPRRVLAWAPLAWLGLISYGIFLWHLRLLGWLTDQGALDWIPGSAFVSLLLAAFALTVTVAAISYYAVERPLLALKDKGPREALASLRRPRRLSRPSSATPASTTSETSAGIRNRVIP